MSDITTRILIEIRDEIRNTNQRLDQTNQRLDQTVERLDHTVERLDHTVERLDRLERRQVEAEVRYATGLSSVVGAIHEVRDLLLEDRRSAARLDDHEKRIHKLEQREPG